MYNPYRNRLLLEDKPFHNKKLSNQQTVYGSFFGRKQSHNMSGKPLPSAIEQTIDEQLDIVRSILFDSYRQKMLDIEARSENNLSLIHI